MSQQSEVQNEQADKKGRKGLNESLLFTNNKIRVVYYWLCFSLAAWGIAELTKDRVFPQGRIPGYKFIMTYTIWGCLMALFYYAMSLLVILRPCKKYRKARRIGLHVAASSYFVIFVFYTFALSWIDGVRINNIIDEEQAKLEWSNSVVKHYLFPILIWTEVLSENFKLKNRDRNWALGVVFFYGILNLLITKIFLKYPIYPGLTWNNWYSVFFVVVNVGMIEIGHRIAVQASRNLRRLFGGNQSTVQE